MNNSIITKTSEYFKKRNIVLPTISELSNPHLIDESIRKKLKNLDKDAIDPLNLFRVHWFNNRDHSDFSKVPEHIVLPSEFTGVEAKIIVNIGRLFPLITAHKVLAAYGCLLPRILNGTFDFENNKAVWPSTGNYCRGGVAISRILGLKSIAILPEGMSKERFSWLEEWVEDKNDIIKTTGTESNVKEIYDACNELKKDSKNDIINQFDEYYNYAIHRAVTGPSFEKSFLEVKGDSDLQAKFYVSASGSSGTLAAGDYLKDHLNSKIAVVEATETFKVSSSVLPSTSKFSPIFTLFSTPIPPSTTREPLSLLVDSVCPDTIKGSLILTLASESITKFPVPDLVLIVFVFTTTLPRDEIPGTLKF